MISKEQKGFTLLELVVTLAVLAVLLGFAVPAFDEAMERRRIQGSVEEVKTRIALARSEAIKRSQIVSVAFATDGDRWCMGLRNNDVGGCDCAATFDGSASAADYCGFDDDFNSDPPPVDQYIVSDTGEGTDLAAPDFNGDMVFAFNPVEGTLTDLADTGDITLSTEEGNYEVTISVNPIGLTSVCYTTNSKPLGRYEACP